MKYELISEESCSGSETATKKESVSFCQLLFLFEFLLGGPYFKKSVFSGLYAWPLLRKEFLRK